MMKLQKIARQSESAGSEGAVYKQSPIRRYRSNHVSLDQVHTLLSAAIQVPAVFHKEPREFAVIQDRGLLKSLSNNIMASVNKEVKVRMPENSKEPNFNVFYNAGTLIVIYSRNQEFLAVADCWLAAESLMLAARCEGLGACVIGLSIATLNTPEWKSRLGILDGSIAVVPVAVGIPERSACSVS